MTTPTDRAIAQAFWRACDTINLDKKSLVDLLHRIELDAFEIDAAAQPITDLHDRIEFALRDAGFGLDEASSIATYVTAPPAASEDAVDAARYRWLLQNFKFRFHRSTSDYLVLDGEVQTPQSLFDENGDIPSLGLGTVIDAARDGEGVGGG